MGAQIVLLEYTIAQLDIGHVHKDKAEEMGHLGYLTSIRDKGVIFDLFEID